MLDKLTTLLTPEWWKLIKPKMLPEYATRMLRVAVDRMSGMEQIAGTTQTYPTTRARYTVLDIPIERIVPNHYRAGESVNVTTVAGTAKQSEWTYYIDSLPSGLTLIGAAPTGQFLVRGMDFRECKTGYEFRNNPAEYGTIIHRGKGVRCIFLAIGGVRRITHRPQDALYLETATDPIAKHAIDNALTDAAVTLGISGTTANATRTIGVPLHTDTVYRVWSEDPYSFLQVSSGTVYAAHAERSMSVQPQSTVQKGEQWTTADQTMSDVFYFPLGQRYAAGTMGDMEVAAFPGIRGEYPDLVVQNGLFQGSQLVELLRRRGCNLLNVWYGIPDSGTQHALGCHLVQDGLQLSQQMIETVDTMSQVSLQDSGVAGIAATATAETLSFTDSAVVQFIV